MYIYTCIYIFMYGGTIGYIHTHTHTHTTSTHMFEFGLVSEMSTSDTLIVHRSRMKSCSS